MAEFKINRLRYTWSGPWAANTAYGKDSVVQYSGKTYACLIAHTSSFTSFYNDLNFVTPQGASTPYWALILDGKTFKGPWVTGRVYNTSNIALFGGQVYICVTPHTSTAFATDSTYWIQYSQFSNWNNSWSINSVYGLGDVVKYGGIVYRCIANHTSASAIAAAADPEIATGLEADLSKWTVVNSGIDYKGIWNTINGVVYPGGTVRYKLNDIVKYGANLWQANTGHSSTTTFNPTRWNLWIPGEEYANSWAVTTVFQQGDIVSYGGYDYISNATNNVGNVPSTDSVSWTVFTKNYNLRGSWNYLTNYRIGDTVRNNGRLYIALFDNLNSDPASSIVAIQYTLAGSSGTTVKVSDSTTVKPGMIVIGTGFNLGQTVSTIVDGTTITLDRPPNGTPSDGQAITFTGVGANWQLISSNNEWLNFWTALDTVSYSVGDLVVWQNATYMCIQSHSNSGNNAKRPDLDLLNSYWTMFISHDKKNALNSAGDIEAYSSGQPTAIPISTDSFALKAVASGSSLSPAWSQIMNINNVFYVAPTGTDSLSSQGWGKTMDRPFKTIAYACQIANRGTVNLNAYKAIYANKTWLTTEMYQWMLYQKANNLAPFTTSSVFDQTRAVNNANYAIDAILYDMTRGGNSQSIQAALIYFAQESTTTFISSAVQGEVPYTIAALNQLLSLVNNVLADTNPSQSFQALNGVSVPSRVSRLDNATTTGVPVFPAITNIEITAGPAIAVLLGYVTTALTNATTVGLPAPYAGATITINVKTGTYNETLPIVVPANCAINGDELRGTVVQPATRLTLTITGASYSTGLFTATNTTGLTANMPFTPTTSVGGLIAGTVYYVVGSSITTTQFGVSTLSGGSLQGLTLATNVSITAYAGDCLKNMFLLRNGSGLRNMTLNGLLGILGPINSFLTARPTGAAYASLDPGTGVNDTSVWIIKRSPYVQNVTTFGYGCVGLKIDGTLHAGGNKSIVCNDFTQVLGDGVGIWVTGPSSVCEAVSVFSYYGYAGYLAENGGRLRATNGNTSYGTFGCIAEGYDLTETPVTGIVFNQSAQVQAQVATSLGAAAQLIRMAYSNAGNAYYTTTTNLLGYSNNFQGASWTPTNLILTKNTVSPINGLTDAWFLASTAGTGILTQAVAIPAAGAVYTNIAGVGGSGTAATFNITVTATTYVVTVNNGGSGYIGNDQITISGALLGGTNPANNCTVTVFSLSGASIATVTLPAAGTIGNTVPVGSALKYTTSLYVKQGTAPSCDLLVTFSGSTTVTNGVNFNFSTGAITTTALGSGTISAPSLSGKVTLTNGWYRLYFSTADSTGLNTTATVTFYPSSSATSGGTYVYAGQYEIAGTVVPAAPSFYLDVAGTTKYTAYANYTITGAGTGALAIGDELRSNSIFETRVTSGGTGYQTASNNAQAGTNQQITISQSDTLLLSNYVGMRLFINSGTGAGQYGYIAYYDSIGKIAQIAKESFVPIEIITTDTTTLTINPLSSIAPLYIGQPVQFIPTYYNTTVTTIGITQMILVSVSGGTTNSIFVNSVAGLSVNMPVTFTTQDTQLLSTLTAGFVYYISSIDTVANSFRITNAIYSAVDWLLTTAVPALGFNTYINYPSYTNYLQGLTANMVVNFPITFTGTSVGGLAVGTTYYINDVVDGANFTVSASLATVTVTAASSSTQALTVASVSSLSALNPIVFTNTSTSGIAIKTKYYISKIVDSTSFQISTALTSVTVTSVSSPGTGNLFTCSSTAGFGGAPYYQPIVFVGNTFGGVVAETVYYILSVAGDGVSFTISSTPGGGAFGSGPATGTMVAKTCLTTNLKTLTTVASMSATGTTTSTKTKFTAGYSNINGTFSTSLFSTVVQGTTYYVNTITATGFTVASSLSNIGVTVFPQSAGNGSMNVVASGWDHQNPATPIAAILDSSSVYYIEPRTIYSSPNFVQTPAVSTISLAPGTSYTSMAYGNNYWIAFPNGNATAAGSADGLTWTSITLPFTASWSGVAYGNGYYVGVASANANAVRSVSGLGWRTISLGVVANWIGVTYGNGTFVVIAADNTATAYSTNFGATWSAGALPGKTLFTATGAAQLSTTQKQFGATSLYLDGTANTFVTSASNANYNFGTGDFTIECWIYVSVIGVAQSVFDMRASATDVSVMAEISSAGLFRMYVNGSYVITGNTTISATTWTHVAVSRASGTTTLYVGGTAQSTTYSDSNTYAARPIVIGAYFNGIARFAGYVDEFRITKGSSRYNGTFTPAGSAFTNDANAVALLHFDGANTSTTMSNAIPAGTYAAMTFGNGRFVAITTGGTAAAYSTNGITWTASTLPSSTTWTSIAFGQSMFVAVSNTSSVSAYSQDGATWYAGNMAIYADKISYGQGVFIALSSAGSSGWTSEDGSNWLNQTVTNDGYGAIAFGFYSNNVGGIISYIGRFATLSGTNVGSSFAAGCKTKSRAIITSGVITQINSWEPGSGYINTPVVSFTDPNVTSIATIVPRVGSGTLSSPTFVNKGSGYNTTSTAIQLNGNGYADAYQSGLTIILNNLSRLPLPGDNLVITGVSQVYKITSATAIFGTTAPNIEANVSISPGMTTALSPANNTTISIRQKYSQVRLTGHDFLNIGYGNVTQSNYPGVPPVTSLKQEQQIIETNYGKVFYASTDQDGNFKVGSLFGVQQATGIVTLSASQFGLTGLNTLSLGGIAVGGSSVVVSQFSTDGNFVANSDNIIPTQKAIKTYLTSRLSQGGSNTQTGQLVAGSVLVGGPNKIASTVPNGQVGSVIKMTSKINFSGATTGIDGNMPAFFYFMNQSSKKS
jgi:hypothetical protein